MHWLACNNPLNILYLIVGRDYQGYKMKYIIEYEISALIFLVVVAYRFFSKRRFPNNQNALFGIVMITAIFDIALDVIGSLAIENALSLPIWVNQLINTTFYCLQLLFPVFLLMYVLLIIKPTALKNKAVYSLLIPYIIFTLIVITNFYHGLIFYIDPIKGYVHGPGFFYLYLCGFFYLSVSYAILKKYRLKIRKIQYRVLIGFIYTIFITMVFQFMLPQYLLTGVSVALAIAMMYFTLQNPEEMLDSFSRTFNYEALLVFLEYLISEKRKFQFVTINIDGMRRINNLFGVMAGNEVMAEVGHYFINLEGKPWVFKMLGTRFVIITFTDTEFKRILNAVSNRFNQSWNINDMHIVLTVNIRYFTNSEGIKKTEDILNLIELAYLRETTHNENKMIKEIDNNLLAQIQRHMEIEKVLREALDSDEGFELYFQPIYSVKYKKFNSLEVLLRFNSPKFGSISPGEFIPIAEKTGLILRIDELVMRKSLMFMSKYNVKETLGLSSIEINLSAAEFINDGFYDRFINIYEEYKIDPTVIIFEITETAATISYDVMVEYMNILRKLGIRFAIDDFGKGYANITQVVNLPFSMVKLDRSLLIAKNENQNNAIIFEDLLNMFRKLGMLIVVEGVETLDDINHVTELQADYIQGFYYAKPMPEAELIQFLADNQ